MVNSKVIVKVKGLQIVEETGDSVETVTPGKYYTRNNKHYVTYEDIDDETGVKTKNIIKFNDSFAEVKRSGFMSGKMIFEKYNKDYFQKLALCLNHVSNDEADCMIQTIEKFYEVMCEGRER